MRSTVANRIASIMWTNEDGITQSELRSFPQDHKEEVKRGLPVDTAEELEPMAIEFRELNPDAKRVWIRVTETTDYQL